MATTLQTTVDAFIKWTFEDDDGSGRVVYDENSLGLNQTLLDGALIDQADVVFSDRRTVSNAANDDLDLAGGLTDSFGNTITFSLVKFILVRNTNTTAAENLDIGGGSNAFASIFGASGDIVTVGPGGLFAIGSPSLAGYAVTAGTGDILRLTGEGGDIVYDIVIVGVKA